MAEDRMEKDLPAASDCEWLRALDASGNGIMISKADMVELIRANIPVVTHEKKGLMDKSAFMERSISNNELSSLESGIYPIFNSYIPDLGFNYGILLVFKSTGYYTLFIAAPFDLSTVKFKTTNAEWRQISFT